GCLGQGVGTLPRCLAGMDSKGPKLASRAAALLRALATALHCRIIKVSAVSRADADVFQRLAFWADIAVLLGQVGELVDAIEIVRLPFSFFFHWNKGSNPAFIDHLQSPPVPLVVTPLKPLTCPRPPPPPCPTLPVEPVPPPLTNLS